MLHKKQIIQHKFYTKCNQLPLKDFQGKRKVIILDWNFRNITLHGELRDPMSLAKVMEDCVEDRVHWILGVNSST